MSEEMPHGFRDPYQHVVSRPGQNEPTGHGPVRGPVSPLVLGRVMGTARPR
ncbi:hypothetical protein [Streptomyces sp. NPDC059371]|uniref:hypothetical protein n=1 Tax=Streptomyces sp. NPDC059371 TaxID=3346812 RepID=UPI00369BA42D